MDGERLKGLNAIRAFCALCILWGHVAQRDFCQWEIVSLPLPECCAYVFFVISGFLAGYRIDKTVGGFSYYKKKARRILPLYYSYLIVSILAYWGIGRLDQVLDSRLWYYLFLLPQIPFCRTEGLLPLVHLWFIGTIVLFYALFPFFAKLKGNVRMIGAAVIAVAWLMLKLALRAFVGTDSVLYHFVGVTSFDVLFAGVWAGLLLKRGNTLLDKARGMTWLSIAAWLLFLCSGLYAQFVPAPVRVEYIAMLALVMVVTQQAVPAFPNLENKFLNWMGTVSYEIYVTQIIVIILLSLGYSKLGVELPAAVIYLVCTAVVIGVAWCSHQVLGLCGTKRLIKERHK